MTISALIRKPNLKHGSNTKATIYFRIRDKNKDFRVASELTIDPNHWSQEKQGYKDRVSLVSVEEKNTLNEHIQNIKSLAIEDYTESSDFNWLSLVIDRYHNPRKYKLREEVEKRQSFEKLFDLFLEKHKLSDVRKKNFRVVKRCLLRYELFVKLTEKGRRDFQLDIDVISADDLSDIWDYLFNEYNYYETHTTIFEQIPEKRKPKPRGKNTLIDYFGKIRTFLLWCFEKKITKNRPFDEFKLEESIYGTPIYITLEERDILYQKDLSHLPDIDIQRDIYIFQSLIGCRIGDYYKMKKKNRINDAIEYIAGKTKDNKPITLRVPLNDKAKAILEKYKDYEGDALLPFISEQKYNEAIKVAFQLAGLDRVVTVLNPTTREEEKRHIFEIASSHMARKTFIGNIYKKVKDPNLIGALSGHKEGSKAFNRYREIDEDLKKELVNFLD